MPRPRSASGSASRFPRRTARSWSNSNAERPRWHRSSGRSTRPGSWSSRSTSCSRRSTTSSSRRPATTSRRTKRAARRPSRSDGAALEPAGDRRARAALGQADLPPPAADGADHRLPDPVAGDPDRRRRQRRRSARLPAGRQLPPVHARRIDDAVDAAGREQRRHRVRGRHRDGVHRSALRGADLPFLDRPRAARRDGRARSPRGRLVPADRGDLRCQDRRGPRRGAGRPPADRPDGDGDRRDRRGDRAPHRQRQRRPGPVPVRLRDPLPVLCLLPAGPDGRAGEDDRRLQPAQLHRRGDLGPDHLRFLRQRAARRADRCGRDRAARAGAQRAGAAVPREDWRMIRESNRAAIAALIARSRNELIRVPGAAIPGVLAPTIFFLGLNGVFGNLVQLRGFDTDNYLSFIIPISMLQGAGFTGAATGVNLARDIEQGWFDRLMASPTPRWVLLSGMVLSACARSLIPATLVLIVALALGAHFPGLDGLLLSALFVAGMAAVAAGWGSMLALRYRS